MHTYLPDVAGVWGGDNPQDAFGGCHGGGSLVVGALPQEVDGDGGGVATGHGWKIKAQL